MADLIVRRNMYEKICRKNIRLDCMVTKTLGAPVCVIHAMNTFRNGVDCPPEKMHKMNTEMFCFGLQFAKQYDIMLATETFGDCRQYKVCDFFGQTDEFIKQIEEISEIGYDGVYNMELELAFYGEELVIETAAFAVKVLRNYLDKRYN